jgi:REP element-mobilizing transposase RayT
MSQSLSHILAHLVFSTKERRNLIIKDIRNELYSYMGGILKSIDSTSIIINGTSDHVHILFRLSKTHALSKVIELVNILRRPYRAEFKFGEHNPGRCPGL